jgi:fumarate hydratase class II
MVCAQVIGNDATITVAGQAGNFQLNVMLPVIAYNLLQSIELLTRGAGLLAEKAMVGFSVNASQLRAALARNPLLATAQSQALGYDDSAEIARRAYAEQRSVRAVAAEMSDLSPPELDRLLDPLRLARARE